MGVTCPRYQALFHAVQLAQAAFEAGHAGLKQHPGLFMLVTIECPSTDVVLGPLGASADRILCPVGSLAKDCARQAGGRGT